VLLATYDGGATNAKLFDKSRIKQNDSNRFVVMIVVDCREDRMSMRLFSIDCTEPSWILGDLMPSSKIKEDRRLIGWKWRGARWKVEGEWVREIVHFGHL
jgi:hypothetical protein